MAKRKTIVDMVTVLAEAYGRKCTQATFEAYVRGLGDMTDEQITTAGNAALRSPREFMPTPGQLRELAIGGQLSIEAMADSAWLTVNQAIDTHGCGKSVNFRDGVINATIRIMGGWDRLGATPKDEFDKWLSREFKSTYARLVREGCARDIAGYLPGYLERENAGWVGKEYGKGGKPYQMPTPIDVASDYTPSLESPPATQQITNRPAGVPRLQFKDANA